MVVIVPVVAVLVVCTVIRVPATVAPFVAIEMLDIFTLMMMRVEVLTARRVLAVPSIVVIVVVINGSPEMGRAAVPGSSADKDSAGKPLRSVVAIRRAIVGRIVEVAVSAYGRGANLH